MSVWIVIPSCNGRHWLEGCLPTLFATTDCNVTTLVIDNGSADGTINWLAQRYPAVRRVPLKTNKGFVDAVNLGMSMAWQSRADWIVLLNNDTRLCPGWLDALLKAGKQNPTIGVVGPLQYDFDGNLSPRSRASLVNAGQPLTGPWPTTIDTDWIEGACLMLRADLVMKVGLLDPLFAPAYWEEVDYCRRVRQAGGKVALVPAARIDHHGAGSAGSVKRDWLLARNQLLYQATDVNKNALAAAGQVLQQSMRILLQRRLGLADWSRMLWSTAIKTPQILDKRRSDRFMIQKELTPS